MSIEELSFEELLKAKTEDTVSRIIDSQAVMTEDDFKAMIALEQKGKKRPEVMNTLQRCIKRKQFPANRPIQYAPYEQPHTNVWQAIHKFFKSYFLFNKNEEYTHVKDGKQLAQWLFHVGHNFKVEDLEPILTGHYQKDGFGYKFLRSDFIREVQ